MIYFCRERAQVMLKAADLCAGKYRADINATTILGQAKTMIQVCLFMLAKLCTLIKKANSNRATTTGLFVVVTKICANSMMPLKCEKFWIGYRNLLNKWLTFCRQKLTPHASWLIFSDSMRILH